MIVKLTDDGLDSSSDGFNILEETDDKFIFPEGALLPGQDNVITIVQVRMLDSRTPSAIDLSVTFPILG